MVERDPSITHEADPPGTDETMTRREFCANTTLVVAGLTAGASVGTSCSGSISANGRSDGVGDTRGGGDSAGDAALPGDGPLHGESDGDAAGGDENAPVGLLAPPTYDGGLTEVVLAVDEAANVDVGAHCSGGDLLYAAQGLPLGLTVDSQTGMVGGAATTPQGTTPATVTVTNVGGVVAIAFTIAVT